jgi:hypothetical protein
MFEEYAKIEMIEEDGKVYASKDEENFKKMKEEKFSTMETWWSVC